MDLLPTAEQDEIVSAAAGILTKDSPRTLIRALRGEASSVDPAAWARYASLGWFSLGLPEEDGGVGYGLVEEMLLFREIGRHLAPGPFLATTLGARVAVRGGGP